MTEDTGREILDFTSGQMCATIGHNHPAIVEAVHKAGETAFHFFSGMIPEAVAQLAAMFVHHTKIHEEVRRQHIQLEICALYVQAGFITNFFEQHVCQRPRAEHHRLGQLRREARSRLRQRHKA